jgi:RNA polymerase sigma-70 factor (ECF subfamily)
VPFEVPRRGTGGAVVVGARVIYLIFNEGYSATAGDDWMRPALCEEALRLGACSPGWRRTNRRCTD